MAGAFLVDLFDFTDGQECLIRKGNFEVSDNVIYIPDIYFNGIETESVLSDEEIENVLDHCYTGNDFVTKCNGNEDLARELFDLLVGSIQIFKVCQMDITMKSLKESTGFQQKS